MHGVLFQHRLPGLAARVQAAARGMRARAQLPRYKAWLVRRARFMTEQARSRAGLAALRAGRADRGGDDARVVLRRVWGRDSFAPCAGGFRPNFAHAEEYALMDYVDRPPQVLVVLFILGG